MSRKQNWYIKKYVCAVSSFLPCSGKTKKPWLDAIRAQAEDYIAQGGDPAALAERFGTPQQVAAAYVDEMPTAELLAQLHTIHQDLSGWSESYVTRYEDYENSEIGDTTQ